MWQIRGRGRIYLIIHDHGAGGIQYMMIKELWWNPSSPTTSSIQNLSRYNDFVFYLIEMKPNHQKLTGLSAAFFINFFGYKRKIFYNRYEKEFAKSIYL